MKYCMMCGKQIDGKVTFCPYCGAAQSSEQQKADRPLNRSDSPDTTGASQRQQNGPQGVPGGIPGQSNGPQSVSGGVPGQSNDPQGVPGGVPGQQNGPQGVPGGVPGQSNGPQGVPGGIPGQQNGPQGVPGGIPGQQNGPQGVPGGIPGQQNGPQGNMQGGWKGPVGPQPIFSQPVYPKQGAKKNSSKTAIIIIVVVVVLLALTASIIAIIAGVHNIITQNGYIGEMIEEESEYNDDSGVINGNDVFIGEAELTHDIYGEDAIVVYVTWKNNGTEAVKASDVFYMSAAQQGMDLRISRPDDQDYYTPLIDAVDVAVEPGATQYVAICFTLDDDYSDITVAAVSASGGGEEISVVYSFE